MAVDYLTSAVAFAEETGLASNQTATFDSGATGADRLLVVAITHENGDDPNITDITYNGVSLTKQASQVGAAGDEFQESAEIWTLVNPATGSNTLALTNAATGYDAAIFAAVYTGVDQTTPVGNTNTLVNLDTNDGEFTITKTAEDDGVAWIVTRDRGHVDAVFTAATDNTKREEANLFDNSTGFISCIGDRFSGSGTVTVGATQTGDAFTEDIVGVGIELLASTGAATEHNASGAVQSDDSIATGQATRTVTSSGAVQSDDSIATGQATRTVTSSGAVQANDATATGQATRTVTSSGAVQANDATATGQATRTVTSSGAVQSDDSTATGQAVGGFNVTASVVATSSASGQISKTISASASVVGASLVTSNAVVNTPVSSTVTGVAIVTGNAEVISDDITASVTARALSQGALSPTKKASGSALSLATSEAVLTSSIQVSSQVVAVATVSASLHLFVFLPAPVQRQAFVESENRVMFEERRSRLMEVVSSR